MKKKFVAAMVSVMLVASLLSGCGSAAKEEATAPAADATAQETDAAAQDTDATAQEKSLKIGLTVQSLSNQLWAVACSTMQELAEAEGNELTYVSCEDNSAKQIQQIEDYISSGCDVIMVHPSDANAVESVCQQAREAGIKVMCWDNEMTNTDLNWVIDNETLGYVIGSQAADFINEKFNNGEVEVAILDYPQTAILLERENGILKALSEKAPNAKIVAQQPAIDANEGLTAMETILQANPDVKVVCCIGGGGAVGANEAFKAAGEITDDIGVFAADATDEELAAMVAGEANRMSVAVTGTPVVIANTVYPMLVHMASETGFTEADLAEGETMNGTNVYRNLIPVTSANVEDFYSK